MSFMSASYGMGGRGDTLPGNKKPRPNVEIYYPEKPVKKGKQCQQN